MSGSLLLIGNGVSEESVTITERLQRLGYQTRPGVAMGHEMDPDFLEEFREVAAQARAVLVLIDGADDDYARNVHSELEQLQPGAPDMYLINVLLTPHAAPIVAGSVVRLLTFSENEVQQLVNVIESRPSRGRDTATGSIAVIWDPTVLEPEEYANLIATIGDVARASGALGVERIDEETIAAFATAGVER